MTNLSYSHFDDRAVRTMQLANYCAGKLNHDYIDTEHILLGLCLNSPSEATAILAQLEITAGQIVAELKRRVLRHGNMVMQGRRTVQPNAKRVTEHAIRVASGLDASAVHTGHLLLGILHAHGSIAFDALTLLGLRYDVVFTRVAKKQ